METSNKKYPFVIELNNHYKPYEISVQCGAEAYTHLPIELQELSESVDNFCTTWVMAAIRKSNGRRAWIRLNKFKVEFVMHIQYATKFTNYKEVKDVANKVLDTDLFTSVIITETIKRDDI